MSQSEVTISCPHCRRQYQMKADPERMQRMQPRATCGRCRKTFDVASRIVTPATPLDEQPAPLRAPPPPTRTPKSEPDEMMADLAREFADVAARFTPVGMRRPAELEHAAPPSTAKSSLAELELPDDAFPEAAREEFMVAEPTRSRPVPPLTWVERADPGLGELTAQKSAGAEALAALLADA